MLPFVHSTHFLHDTGMLSHNPCEAHLVQNVTAPVIALPCDKFVAMFAKIDYDRFLFLYTLLYSLHSIESLLSVETHDYLELS